MMVLLPSSLISRTIHSANIAENVTYLSGKFSKVPLLSSASLVTCCAAVAESQKGEPNVFPNVFRQGIIPLIVRDEHGKFSIQLPTNAPPRAPDDDRPNDIKPLQPQNQQQRSSISSPARKKKAPTPMPKYSKAARRFYNEKFRQPQRLSKVLAAAGVASRRGSEEVIFEGRVTVNGTVCTVPQTMVDPLKDSIYVDGGSLPKKLAPKLYFAVNKPKGYICSCSEHEEKSVLTLLDGYMKIWVQRNPGLPKPRLFTVGRLDVATTGLIFVTNDGDFAFNVSHPSSGFTKEYIATVGSKVTKRQLQVISDGTEIQRMRCVPDVVEILEAEQGDTKNRLRIVVSEGRNHEVRQLVENAGLEVNALKRVRIGGYRMPRTLGLGKHVLLTDADIKKVQLVTDQRKE